MTSAFQTYTDKSAITYKRVYVSPYVDMYMYRYISVGNGNRNLNSAFVVASAQTPVYFKQIPLNAYDLFLFHFLAKRNQTLFTFGFDMAFL